MLDDINILPSLDYLNCMKIKISDFPTYVVYGLFSVQVCANYEDIFFSAFLEQL